MASSIVVSPGIMFSQHGGEHAGCTIQEYHHVYLEFDIDDAAQEDITKSRKTAIKTNMFFFIIIYLAIICD